MYLIECSFVFTAIVITQSFCFLLGSFLSWMTLLGGPLLSVPTTARNTISTEHLCWIILAWYREWYREQECQFLYLKIWIYYQHSLSICLLYRNVLTFVKYLWFFLHVGTLRIFGWSISHLLNVREILRYLPGTLGNTWYPPVPWEVLLGTRESNHNLKKRKQFYILLCQKTNIK